MILQSIRWRLQLWHGVLLLVVLAGFGYAAHRLQRANELRRVDQELQQCFGPLHEALRHLRPEPPEFRLPPNRAAMFEGGSNGCYYVVWWRDGKELSRSASAPADVLPPVRAADFGPRANARQRGDWRELYVFTPRGECLLAGRSMASELDKLGELGWWLAGLGSAVLVVGLGGGYWVATRVIRPIDQISATAAKIAAGDLSQRIDAADTDNELGRLAAVLNSTFSRLETSFTQQAQFTSDASHELRTPVSVILTQTQTVLARERSAAEYRETLQTCQRAAQRMRRLIDSLLELARLDAGQEPFKRDYIDLRRTAEDCVQLVRPLADERRIVVQQELGDAGCLGDSARLEQVVTNLLTNAILHNRVGGEVRLSTRLESGFAVVRVADNGPGIPAEDLPRLFERFYRADKSRNSASGGTGLGLAIASAIVEAHGGVLQVASEVGKGSAFEVQLPASQG